MTNQSRTERDLSLIVELSSGVGFGTMLAISQAVRYRETGISFHLSAWTALAFLAGFGFAFAYLRVLLVTTVGAFLYPFRSNTLDNLAQRFAGIAAALCFITTGLTLVRRFVRAAEREEEEQEAEERPALKNGTTIREYDPGTWGPAEAERITPADGWRNRVESSSKP